MRQIKKGDTVRAHLDGTFVGKVVSISASKPAGYSAQGPLDVEIFCFVELKDGTVVKKKSTDLFIED